MNKIVEEIEKYKVKMRMLYQCEIETEFMGESTAVVLKRVKNYKDAKFIVPKFVDYIGEGCFKFTEIEEVILSNARVIERDAFVGCSRLRRVDLCNVRYISSDAFYDCIRLEEIDLSKVVDIRASAFAGCASLKSIDLKAIKNLGQNCFRGCSKLEYVNLHDYKTIEHGMFEGCTNLKDIIGNKIEKILGSALASTKVDGSILRNGVKKIGRYAFYDCNNIKNLVIPGSITWVLESAFAGCDELERVKIEDGVQKVFNGAFRGCNKLKDIEVYDSIEIYKEAFGKLDILKEFSSTHDIRDMGDKYYLKLKEVRIFDGDKMSCK